MLTEVPAVSPVPPPGIPAAAPDGLLASAGLSSPAQDAQDASEWKETLVYFRRLGAYMWPYRVRFFIGELAGLGFAVFNGILPLLLAVVLQHASPGSAAHGTVKGAKTSGFSGAMFHYFNHLAEGKYGVLLVCSAIPAVMLLRCLFDYINNYQVAWVSLKVLADMRRQVFAHINAQSLHFFNQSRSGNLISRVNNDTRIVQTALSYIGTDLIEQPATAIVVICTLLALDWRFTLMALVLFPLGMAPLLIYGKRIRKTGRQEEEQSGAMTSILQESFAGIRVIKSFAREDYQVEQFDAANISQFETGIRVRRYTEIVGPLVEVVAALGVGLALVYVHYAGMELFKFFALTSGLFLLYTPIKQMSRMHMQIQKCRAASSNVFALLALQPTVRDEPGAVALADCQGEIEFKSLCFQYEGAPSLALDHFNLRIRPGKTVALVGASGAGKSTVLSLLQRFYDPLAGSVCVDGRDVRQLTQRSLREAIGVVTQDTFLFHDTIYENIRYGRLEATAEEIAAAAQQAYIHDFILTLSEGYQTRIGDKGCRLSGGQQQRLAIARALLKNAPILLLDEATSALDSESERVIQVALETLSAGKTVVAIAHRLSTILKADQIIVMDGGKIVETGKHQRLYEQNGRYRRLYDLQFDHEAHRDATLGAAPVFPSPAAGLFAGVAAPLGAEV
jgi:subfamily B ATP-binding cassette protein MsbA